MSLFRDDHPCLLFPLFLAQVGLLLSRDAVPSLSIHRKSGMIDKPSAIGASPKPHINFARCWQPRNGRRMAGP